MKRSLLAISLFALSGIGMTTPGQISPVNEKSTVPNFSGTWQFDRSRSKPDDFLEEVISTVKSYDMQIVIQQKGLEITIKKIGKYDSSNLKDPFPPEAIQLETYHADGRGENDPIDIDISRHQSVAKIIGDKLAILYFTLDDYNRKVLAATSEYSLTDNGNTLICDSKGVLADKKAAEDKTKPRFDSLLVFNRAK
jgi:hypothetical protein